MRRSSGTFKIVIQKNVLEPHQLLTVAHQSRGVSRTAASSNMELFVIIVNGVQPLTIITKCSILDVAAVLDPPLATYSSLIII